VGVRSKLLVAGLILTSTAITEAYTAPVGETPIIKWLSVTNGTAGAVTLGAGFRPTPGSGTGQRYRIYKRSIPANSDLQLALWWVMIEGHALFFEAGTANALADIAETPAELERQRGAVIAGLQAIDRLMPKLHTFILAAGSMELDNLLHTTAAGSGKGE